MLTRRALLSLLAATPLARFIPTPEPEPYVGVTSEDIRALMNALPPMPDEVLWITIPRAKTLAAGLAVGDTIDVTAWTGDTPRRYTVTSIDGDHVSVVK